jgi:hypothetical protein
MRLSHTDFNPSIEDYANPLTRFAMQDYPEDGGKGMSEVFNGEKMLFELPSPPAAKVDGEIYFVNELLQDSSGDYFLPQRFFFASYGLSSDTADKLLHALGRAVQRTEVISLLRILTNLANTTIGWVYCWRRARDHPDVYLSEVIQRVISR